MKRWKTFEIGSFLTERQERFKPEDANSLGLKRIEKIDFSGNIQITNNRPTRTDMILVKTGDLVISGINAEKGAVSVYEGAQDVLATIHYSSYQLDGSKINVEYLKWFLQSETFLTILQDQSGGGIKTELKPKDLLPLKIPLPDPDIQREIAKKINGVANEIDQLKSINGQNQIFITQLRQAILQQAALGNLVPQDPTDEPASELLKRIKDEKERLIREKKIKKEQPLPPISEQEIPHELSERWVWVRLNELGQVCGGGTPSKDRSEYWNGNIVWVSPKDMGHDAITDSELKITEKALNNSSANLIPAGSILIVARSGILKRKLPVSINLVDCAVNQDIKVIIPYVAEMNRYIQLMLKGFESFILKNLVKQGMTVQSLECNKFELQPFPLPPLNEQKRIVAKVDALMSMCDELENQIRQSKEESEKLMQAVLREAFEGKYSEESDQGISLDEKQVSKEVSI